MKSLISFISSIVCLLMISVTSSAGENTELIVKTTLRIEVTGLQSAQGNIYIAVYDSDETWLGEETVHERQVVIAEARNEDGLLSIELDLTPGEYALSIFHDSNNNGDLDTNFIGIPKEPVALSNNARPRFGPPKYKDAVFTLGEKGHTQRITMENI